MFRNWQWIGLAAVALLAGAGCGRKAKPLADQPIVVGDGSITLYDPDGKVILSDYNRTASVPKDTAAGKLAFGGVTHTLSGDWYVTSQSTSGFRMAPVDKSAGKAIQLICPDAKGWILEDQTYSCKVATQLTPAELHLPSGDCSGASPCPLQCASAKCELRVHFQP